MAKRIFWVSVFVLSVVFIVFIVIYSQYKSHSQKGIELAKSGQYEEAILEFEKAAKFTSKKDIDLLHNLAKVYAKSKQFETAVSLYKRILTINPNDGASYKMLAAIYAMQAGERKDPEKIREAVQSLEKAFALSPSLMDEKDRSFLEFLKQQLNKQN